MNFGTRVIKGRRGALLLAVAIVLFCSTAVMAKWLVRSRPAEQTRPLQDVAEAEAKFEQGGKGYFLIDGNMYRRDAAAGKLVFVDKWYDPDFYAKNFVKVEGVVHQKDPNSSKLYPLYRHFEEDFEDASSVADLINEKRGWTSMSLWSPKTPGVAQSNALVKQLVRGKSTFIDNRVEPSLELAHVGKSALKCYCVPPSRGMVTAKASISSFFMHYQKGDDVWFRGWYYVADGGKPFTLMDLESTWIKEHPGMRICLPESGFLGVELKWADKPTHRQPRGKEISFPIGKWVELKLHLRLTEQSDGIIELWQDGVGIVKSKGQTLPLAGSVYDSLEVGISAHSLGNQAATVYVDDIVLTTKPLE